MKPFLLVLAVSLVSVLCAAPVPKEKPALFDPSGVWVTESLSSRGEVFDAGDGHDLGKSRFEISLKKKTVVFTLSQSGDVSTYPITNLTQSEKDCRWEGVAEEKLAYMLRYRVLCKRAGDTLWLALIKKHKPFDAEDWPSVFESKAGRRTGDPEADFVLKLEKTEQ